MVERAAGWLADHGDRIVDLAARRLGLGGVLLCALVVLAVLMRHFFPGGYRW